MPETDNKTDTTWYLRSGHIYNPEERVGYGVLTHTLRFKGAVKVLGKDRAAVSEVDVCGRCGGAGGSHKWDHTGFTCYDCGGTGQKGLREVKLYTKEKLDKLEAASEKRRAKAAAERQAKAEAEAKERAKLKDQRIEENRRFFPEAMEYLEHYEGENEFLTSIKEKAFAGWELSERMAEAVLRTRNAIKKHEDWDNFIKSIEANDGAAPTGRVELQGYVISAQWRVSGKDYHAREVLKILLIDERGFKVWCSAPKGMTEGMKFIETEDDYYLDLKTARGLHIKFKATLAPQERDFAFGSRPTKCELIELPKAEEITD